MPPENYQSSSMNLVKSHRNLSHSYTLIMKDQKEKQRKQSNLPLQQKENKGPLTEKWIKKMWYIYTMEYHSAIKKIKIMPLAAIWMGLEINILSEVSQRQI